MMEGARLRRKHLEKAHVGVLFLLMCVLIPTNALPQVLQTPQTPQCPDGDYFNEVQQICCNKCSPGFRLLKDCLIEGHKSTCGKCPERQYTDKINYAPTCRSCRICKADNNEIVVSPCKRDKDTICQCKNGFYRHNIDSEKYECRSCSKCGPDERERQMCTPTNDTVCDCKENYYRDKRRCKPCEECSTDCSLHCTSLPPLNTKATEPSSSFFFNVIAGCAAVFLVMLAVVAVITHMATKHFTKRRLNNPVSQQSDDSSDSCEQVLIDDEEPSKTNTAAPHSPTSDQEVSMSKLPDCVPWEIKISDLIYSVLDQVPVHQVKQLVRSLGVSDMEIEQAELDYRPCREAHYQMLRVWAEKGSLATGGGRKGMLHRPLLEELLDKLREMHLGKAAEELETKYDIQ